MEIKPRVQQANRRDNVIVYGEPLSGKTTYVKNQVDEKTTLHIQTDGNARPGSVVVDATDWDTLIACIDYAIKNEKIQTIVLDLLDDAVAFAEARAQARLGMSGKADMKGAYNRFVNTVGELVKESVLRPLLMSGKQVYVIMHSMTNAQGEEVPCFGSYSSDAMAILNWVKGRSGKIVRCVESAGVYEQIVEAERIYEESEPAPVKTNRKPPVKKAR